MTLVSDIILDAYRESNLVSINATPTTAEQTEGLRLLSRLRFSVLGNEAGENLKAFSVGGNNIKSPTGFPYQPYIKDPNWYIPDNSELILNLTSALTLSLNPTPGDGAVFSIVDASSNLATYNLTILGNGNTIENSISRVFNINGYTRQWQYNMRTANWEYIALTLALSDAWVYPQEFDDMFITMLSMKLNSRQGQPADPLTVTSFKRSLRQFRARYRQTRVVASEAGIVRLSRGMLNRQRNTLNGVYDTAAAFNSGKY